MAVTPKFDEVFASYTSHGNWWQRPTYEPELVEEARGHFNELITYYDPERVDMSKAEMIMAQSIGIARRALLRRATASRSPDA